METVVEATMLLLVLHTRNKIPHLEIHKFPFLWVGSSKLISLLHKENSKLISRLLNKENLTFIGAVGELGSKQSLVGCKSNNPRVLANVMNLVYSCEYFMGWSKNLDRLRRDV